MTDAIDRFAVEYQEYHQISPARRREQITLLRRLEAFGGGDILAADSDVVRAFLSAELAGGKAPTTVGKIAGLLKPFFGWAWEAKLVTAEHHMGIRAVRSPRGATSSGRPRPYTRFEIMDLWKDWNRDYPYGGGDFNDLESAVKRWERFERGTASWRLVRPFAERLQSRAIICLALMGGLRRDEIFRLSVDDMHYENAYVKVTGAAKNREARPVERPVPWTTPQMRTAVQEWVDLRELLAPPHERPWLSLWGPTRLDPLRHRRYEMLLTTLGRGWEFHRMRHTAATEMLRSGYPLETVQKVMGHARITQTLAYAELLPEDVVAVAGKCEVKLSTVLEMA